MSARSNIPLPNLRIKVPLHRQVLPAIHILNHEALLVGQVQEADEAVGRGDVGELGFGVDVREVVHDVGEHEGAGFVFGEDGDLGALVGLGGWRFSVGRCQLVVIFSGGGCIVVRTFLRSRCLATSLLSIVVRRLSLLHERIARTLVVISCSV